MVSPNAVLALIFTLAMAAMAPTQAEPAAAELATVTVSAHRLASSCDGLKPDQARVLAQEAQRDGAHRKAAECFRIAGDHARADHEQLRASANTGAVTTQKVAANLRPQSPRRGACATPFVDPQR